VAWNLTQRCNLACAHCYISAGSWHGADGELSTAECHRIADEIFELNASPMFILSGGEPLLRDDLEDIAQHAARRGATVVVGTNGTRLTRERIRSLMAAGVKGAALSIDSLDATYHDRFRHGGGALDETLAAVERLGEEQLDFIVQTTVTRGNRNELQRLAAYAAERGAVSFNVYFLVPTGRGQKMFRMTPAENEQVLGELLELEQEYRGRMLVRSKCMPQIMRHAYERDPFSPLLNYETRCPCGLQYCRITPEGKVTPCPYSPAVAGDLRQQSFGEIWKQSALFATLRSGALGGKCASCEYREICGGCRARAYAETGDVLAEDASCAYEPTGTVAPVARRNAVTYGGVSGVSAVSGVAGVSGAGLEWTADARARLERIPSFVRAVVSDRVERFARERGHTVVTAELMSEIRQAMPVDFSKRLPFFARRSDA
jgi:radical SAM protein with 4Fe4S-binding SPASM domain